MKLFQKLKNREKRPMSEKKKGFLKGLLFGSIAGAVLSFVVVGVVGCSVGKADKADEPKTSNVKKAIEPNRAFSEGNLSFYALRSSFYTSSFSKFSLRQKNDVSTTSSVGGWIYDVQANASSVVKLGDFAYSLGGDVNSEVESKRGYDIVPVVTDNISYSTATYPYVCFKYHGEVSSNVGVINVYSPLFDIRTLPSGDLSDYYVDVDEWYDSTVIPTSLALWSDVFMPLGDIVDLTGGSSSEESSSSNGSASSESVPPAVDSVDVKSRAFTFAEVNPFSAWAVNPLSDDRATGYDLGAPWLLYTGKPSGSGATTEITAKYTTYEVGEFYVNGNASATFDAIALTTLNLSTDNAFVFDGETDAQNVSADMFARGAFIISEVSYLNTTSGNSLKVMAFGSTSATLNGNPVTALTAPRWLNVGFRNIVYVGGDGNVSINGYTAPATWWLENNGLSQTAGVSTMVLGNSSTGVFGLLASSFGAIGSILGISLIPGLTIGTLMFIPLVVLVIFAIIKILNK